MVNSLMIWWYLKKKLVFFLNLPALFTVQSPQITGPGVLVMFSGRGQVRCAYFNLTEVGILTFIF